MKSFMITISGLVDDDVSDEWLWAMASCAEVQVAEPEIYNGDTDSGNPIRFNTHEVNTTISIKPLRTTQPPADRCAGSGKTLAYGAGVQLCPGNCGKLVKPFSPADSYAYSVVPNHGTNDTRSRRAHQARLQLDLERQQERASR